MKSRLLLSTAALLAGVALASAQTTQRGAGEQGISPGAQKNAPGAQGAQGTSSGSAMPQRGTERPAQDAGRATTGQAPAAGDRAPQQGQAQQGRQDQMGAERTQRQQDRTMGQGPQRDNAQRDRTQQRQQRGQSDRMGQDDRRGAQSQQRQQRRQTEGQAGTREDRQDRAGTRQDRQDRAGTAARGDARGRVTLNTQQRTRIRQTVLAGRNVPRVDRVNFSLRVGIAVPSHIHLVAVPAALIAIHPGWRGHMYFVVDDDIVIVDDSREIVSVVSVGSSQAGVGGPVEGGGNAMAMGLSEAEIREVQQVLIARGFYDGEVDGIFGPGTRAALITFQRREGIAVTGRIDTRTVTAMKLSGKITIREGTQTRQRSTVGQGRDTAQPRQNRDSQRSQSRDANKQPSRSRDATQQPRDRQNMNARQPSRDRSPTGQAGDNRQPRANQRMQPAQNERSGSAPTTTSRGSGADQPQANQPMQRGQSGMNSSPRSTTGSSTTGQGSEPSARMPRERESSGPAASPSGGQAR